MRSELRPVAVDAAEDRDDAEHAAAAPAVIAPYPIAALIERRLGSSGHFSPMVPVGGL